MAPTGRGEADIEHRLMPDVGEDEPAVEWAAVPAGQTVIVIDGWVTGEDVLLGHLHGGMVRADVTAPDDGLISRIEITTPAPTGE